MILKTLIKIAAGLIPAASLTLPAAANITAWYPDTGEYTRFWFDWSAGTFAPYAFLNSVTLPFVDIVGYWFFVLLWGAYLFAIWNRAASLEIVVITMLIAGPLWGLFLPPESFPVAYLCLAIGIAAIIYKLWKK